MSIRPPKTRGFTLVEMLITMAMGLIVGAAIVLLYFYTSRSFMTLDNYVDMCESSRLALDKMSKDIRQSKQITGFGTNSISLLDVNGNALQFTYNPSAKTLIKTSGGVNTTYLANCDSLQFWIYQPTPTSNSLACYSPAYVTNARVVQVTWRCSRQIMGKATTTETVESAQVALRNH